MNISLRKIDEYYKEVIISADNTAINLGFFNEDEQRELANILTNAASKLVPEAEDLESQLVTAADKLNSWARELDVEECKDPYKDYQLRNLVDRIWDRVSDKIEVLKSKYYNLRSKEE